MVVMKGLRQLHNYSMFKDLIPHDAPTDAPG